MFGSLLHFLYPVISIISYSPMTILVTHGFTSCDINLKFSLTLKTVAHVSNQFSTQIQQFQSDGGGEYDNNQFRSFCTSLGIHHRFSCPHTLEQNGLAERKLRYISTVAHTLLFTSHFPLCHWPATLSTALYLLY